MGRFNRFVPTWEEAIFKPLLEQTNQRHDGLRVFSHAAGNPYADAKIYLAVMAPSVP